MYIESSEAIERAKKADWPMKQEEQFYIIEAPDGYKFYLLNKPQPHDSGNES